MDSSKQVVNSDPGEAKCRFARVFEALQKQREGNTGIVPLLAYGIYKGKKQEKIEKLRQELKRDPTSEELEPFVNDALLHLDIYLSEAERQQALYAQLLIGELDAVREEEHKEKVKKFKPTPWYVGMWHGCLGSFLFLFLGTLMGKGGFFGAVIQAKINLLFPHP